MGCQESGARAGQSRPSGGPTRPPWVDAMSDVIPEDLMREQAVWPQTRCGVVVDLRALETPGC